MKKRIFQSLFLVLFAGIFAACDPVQKVTYYFENKSGGNVYVDRGVGIDTIKSNEVKTLASISRIGGDTPAGSVYGSSKVYNDADTCKKVIGADSNWVKTNPKKATYEYHFVVEDKDF